MSKESRLVVENDDLHSGIAKALHKTSLLAKAGYGPGGGNAMLEQKYGDPLLSRDGVTNIRRLFLEDPIENMAARTVVQSSSMSNKNVGDGTTAVILLTHALYAAGRKLIVSGYTRSEVAQMLKDVAVNIKKQVKSLAANFTNDMLVKVARTSLGDEALAKLVEEVFNELGSDAGVLVESYGGSDIYSEIVDGFYFNKGFTALALVNDPSNLRATFEGEVPILISEKRLLTKTDIGPILAELVKHNINEVVLIGECSPEVLDVFFANRIGGSVSVTAVDAPVYEGMRTLFMNDLALLTGATVYTPGSNPVDFNVEMLGFAKKVVIDERSTKIIGADGSTEKVQERIKDLKEQLKNSTQQYDMDILRERISRLNGKLAIIHVGSATEIEREEVKLRIDDAVCAIRAAFKEGVVPGGGVTLARVDAGQFKNAYESLIKQLAENCGENPERILQKVQEAPEWHGFDFKHPTDNPIDLREAGILDPTLVVLELVKNATSIAASLITASVGTVLVDREAKAD